MAFKVKINGIEVEKKNRIVLEIVKQYIKTNPNITYNELREIFPDDKQGSIGVLKNEEALISWENDGRTEKRKKRFFTEPNDVISLNGDKIYVCHQWGDSENNPNFKPFIEYARNELGFNIEYTNKSFYGLWIKKDENIDDIIESGIWINNLSNVDRIPNQMSKFEIGDEVFLYQNIEDTKIKDTPFMEFLPTEYAYKENTLVKVKCWSTGIVKKIEDKSLEIEWNKKYHPNEWYGYFRQDGVWNFEINDTNSLQQQKYKLLYDMVFNNKNQDYKWWFENGVLDRRDTKNEDNILQNKAYNKVKNIILYGSPGVGKTHNTKKLISLIESGKSDKKIFEIIKNNELNDVVDIDDIKDRVKFITFHQSFGYEDFIEGFRPNEEGNIELVNGVFKLICKEAQKNLDDSLKAEIDISEEKKFEVLFELFKDYIQDELDKNQKFIINNTAYITNIEENAFRYQGDNWGNTQRMKFDDIELLYSKNISERKEIKKVEGISGLAKQHATYFSYFMKQLLVFESKENIQVDSIEKVERKNYYLVIDEINRGNISKIFGELITLIEEDKRDTLEVTLPYSKKPFKIPSNLYIIGTMNSTDKSIALIDIALRRRFTFLKMEPKVDLINYPKARQIFEEVNKKITETLGEDYQIGHSYFMKIQNDDDLDFVLEYKIIPLLEEYYYGDDRSTEVIALCKQDITWSNNE